MKILGLFPGQGSQVVGMGKRLFEENEEVRELFNIADRTLDCELSRLCFEGPIEQLTLTKHAQPAILLVSTAAYRISATKIVAAAGHSLGEYTALVAANCLNFEDALQLVYNRGRYMQEAVRPGEGRMVAVLGPGVEEINSVIQNTAEGIKEIANLNCPGQIVVAGDVSGIEAFSKNMSAAGAKIIPLNVSAPFHCSLMKPAAEKLALDLDQIEFANPIFPVYSNVEAQPITSGIQARELLKRQVCAPVRWIECMENAIAKEDIGKAIEFGPGGVLTKLLKRINSKIPREEFF